MKLLAAALKLDRTDLTGDTSMQYELTTVSPCHPCLHGYCLLCLPMQCPLFLRVMKIDLSHLYGYIHFHPISLVFSPSVDSCICIIQSRSHSCCDDTPTVPDRQLRRSSGLNWQTSKAVPNVNDMRSGNKRDLLVRFAKKAYSTDMSPPGR